MDLGSVETATHTKNIHAKSVPIVLAVSVLAGLFAYFIYRAAATAVTQDSQFILLVAFVAIGFELVWLAYGAVLGILKLLN